MITHPGQDTLLAHADGELPAEAEREVALHVSGCAACGASVAALRGSSVLFAGSLELLDGAEPARWSAGALGRTPEHAEHAGVLMLDSAQRSASRVPRAARVKHSHFAGRSAMRWAAGIFLIAGAASAAVLAGRAAVSDREPAPVTEPAPAQVEPNVAAVIATPVGSAVRVTVSGAGVGSRLHVAFGGTEVSVAVVGGDSPRFTAAPGRVDVDLRGAQASVRIMLPASLRALTVAAAGVEVVRAGLGSVEPAAAATEGIPIDTSAIPHME